MFLVIADETNYEYNYFKEMKETNFSSNLSPATLSKDSGCVDKFH